MSEQRNDRPLGKILHILNKEAVTRPIKPFVAKGAKVVLEDLKEIGILGDPFGPTSQPYQPILLSGKISEDIIGKFAFVQVKKKSRNRRRRRRRGKSNKK